MMMSAPSSSLLPSSSTTTATATSLRAQWATERQQRETKACRIVEVHGTNMSTLVSEVVGLVEYYRIYRLRTVWDKTWSNNNSTCMDKLLSSLNRNSKQLPLENPEQFANDIANYISSSWTPLPLLKKKRKK
jgi:hypothetical protein